MGFFSPQARLAPANKGDKQREHVDFVVSQSKSQTKHFFLVIEVKKDLPRLALKDCMLSLDRVRQLEPGRKVGEKQVRKFYYIN